MVKLTPACLCLLEMCVIGKTKVHTKQAAIAPLHSILGKFWLKLDAPLDEQGVGKLEPGTLAKIVQVTSAL